MNRRMRNRTYGGVRGDGGNPVPYSILVLSSIPRLLEIEGDAVAAGMLGGVKAVISHFD
jgi:hypothetical protein